MESLNLNHEETRKLVEIADRYFGGVKSKALRAGFNMLCAAHGDNSLAMSLEGRRGNATKAREGTSVEDTKARVMAYDDTAMITGSALSRVDLDCASIAAFELKQNTPGPEINELAQWHRELVMGVNITSIERFLALCKTKQKSPMELTEWAMNLYGSRWSACDTIANMCMRQVGKWAELVSQLRAANSGMLSEEIP